MKRYLSTRVWILIVALLLALVAISPTPFQKDVVVSSVPVDSALAAAGLASGDVIVKIGTVSISSLSEVAPALEEYRYGEQELQIVTSEEEVQVVVSNDLGLAVDENLTVLSSVHGLTEGSRLLSLNAVVLENESSFLEFYDAFIPKRTVRIETEEGLVAYLSREFPSFTVAEGGVSNLRFGLDFTGGTRVLLQPVSDVAVTEQDVQDIIAVLSNRLNVYGLSDVKIRGASDWDGNQYVLVEIARVTEEEVRELISAEGVFEAKVGEEVVFEGGEKDVSYVCRNDGTCAGVRACDDFEGVSQCEFQFSITISELAAQRFAAATADLPVVVGQGGQEYLNQTIDFYLDGELVDSLQIASDLQGRETTSIAISGPGTGATQQDALEDALANMNTLQTVLITGSLPFDLEIAKVDTISPVLGEEFLKNVVLVALLAILVVGIVLFVRYRMVKVVVPVMVAMVSEVVLILGFAAVVGWNLDIAALAGIVAAIGTGVDDQIVILDETLRGGARSGHWKEKVKRAFFIIFVAYATTVVAMIPLWNAGAGLLRGFALTTIVGVTIGVFITRPAFASFVEKLF